MQEKTSHYLILIFFLALFLISIFLVGWLLRPFIAVIVLGLVATGVSSPVYNALKNRMRPAFASILTCVLIFIVLFIPIVLFVGIVSKEAYELYLMGKNALISDRIKDLLAGSSILERTNQVLGNFNVRLTGEMLHKLVSETGRIVGLFLYKQASLIASNILNFIINFFFVLLVIYFLLLDGHRMISFITTLSPLPEEQDEKLIQKFKDIGGAILIGNGLCGLLQGVLGGMIFALFGINSPFLWGVIMSLLAFLPIVGIGIVFIPASIYLLLTGKTASGIFFIFFYAALSGSVEYILKPKLVGDRVKMHTLLVFFSIIGGLKLFGILGIIYGPLIITAFLTLSDIYRANYQVFVTNGTNNK